MSERGRMAWEMLEQNNSYDLCMKRARIYSAGGEFD